MNNWYTNFKAITDYSLCSTEDLQKLKKGLKNEYKEFIHDSFEELCKDSVSKEIKQIDENYTQAINFVENEIGRKEGAYNFYEIYTGKSIYEVLENSILKLQQYNVTINVDIIAETTRGKYKVEIEDVKDTKELFRVIESYLNMNKRKKNIKIHINCRAVKEDACYDSYSSTFIKTA